MPQRGNRRASNNQDSECSGSRAGSVSSTGSSRAVNSKSTVGTTFFLVSVPLIPFILRLDKQYPRRLVFLGILAEIAQLFAFVINPHAPYGTIMTAIGRIVYSSHFPLWDREHADIGYYPGLVVFGIFGFVVVAIFGWAVWSVVNHKQQTQLPGWKWCQGAAHSLSTWLFVPFASCFLAFGVCDGDGRLWVTDADCAGVGPTVVNVSCWVLLLLLFFVAYIVNTTAFDASVFSNHHLARAHARVDKVVCVWKLATLVLFHVLNAYGKSRWFHLYFLFSTLFLSACHAFFLPYYRHAVNQVKTAAYFAAAWASFVALLCDVGGAFTAMELDFTLMGCGLLPMWCIGTMLAGARVSSTYLTWKTLFLAGAVKETPAVQLKGLAQDRDHYQPAVELSVGLTDGFPEAHEPRAFAGGAAPEFLVPYIDRVCTATDCELATRFARDYTVWTGDPCTSRMLDLSVQIFCGALVSFKDSDILPLQLAYFTCFHSEETRVKNFTLYSHLDHYIAKMEASLSVRYHAAKLTILLKQAIGLKDNSHVKIWRAAQKLHKEVLSQMSTFWAKLLNSQVDTVQLAVITNGITNKRDEAEQEFKKVMVVSKDDKVLTSYALFLEQVMHDEDAAAVMREQRGQSDMRSQMSKGGESHTPDIAASADIHNTLSLTKLKYTLMFMVLVLIVFATAIFAYQTHVHNRQLAVIRGLQTSGSANALAQQAGYHALDICAQIPKCSSEAIAGVPSSASMSDTLSSTLTARLTQLRRVADDFQANHEFLTSGKDQSNYEPLVSYNKQPTISLAITFPVDTQEPIEGQRQSTSLWSAGYEYAAVLRHIYSGEASDSSLLMAFHWVSKNVDGAISELFSHAVFLRNEEMETLYDESFLLTTMFLAWGLITIQIVYVLLVTSFEEIEQAKLEALNLFTLIPKPELINLHKVSRSKLHRLDKSEQENTAAAELKDETDDARSLHSEDDDAAHYIPPPTLDEFEEDYLRDEEKATAPDWTVKATLILLFAVTLLCIASSSMAVQTLSDAFEPYESRSKIVQMLIDFDANVNEEVAAVKQFADTGDPYYLVGFLELAESRQTTEGKKLLLENDAGVETSSLFDDLVDLHELLSRYARICLRLCASYYETSPDLFGSIAYETWTQELSLEAELRQIAENRPNNKATDLNLPVDEKRELISKMLVSVDGVAEAIRALFEKTVLSTSRVQAQKVEEHFAGTWLIAALAGHVVLTTGCLFFFSFFKRCPLLFRSKPLLILALLFSAASVVGLVYSVAAWQHYEMRTSTADDLETGLSAYTSLRDTLRGLFSTGKRFVRTGDPDAYAGYWNAVSSSEVAAALDSLRATPVRRGELEALFEKLHRLSAVGMTLKLWSLGVDSVSWAEGEYFEVAGLTWDFASEADYNVLLSQYPHAEWYSTESEDILLPSEKQVSLAGSTVSNVRYAKVVRDLRSSIKSLTEDWFADVVDQSSTRGVTRREVVVVQIVAVVTCFVLFVYLVSLFLHFLEATRQFTGNMADAHDSGHTRKTQLCLLIVAALIAALYVLQLLSLVDFNKQAGVAAQTSYREAGVANAQFLVAKIAFGGGNVAAEKKALARKLDELEDTQAMLYFGEDRTSGSYNDLAEPDLLFGQDVDFSLPVCTSEAEADQARPLLAKGADIAMRHWIDTARVFIASPGSAAQYETLLATAEPLIFALEQSTAEYHKKVEDTEAMYFQWFLVVLFVMVIVVFIELVFVFRPMNSELLHQDSGTRLMLKMIPEEVRETIPVIQEFLDSGLVRDADPLEAINESINEMSTVPIIAIDHLGTVIRFTHSGEAVFGWQQREVVGSNIKLLMPQEYARHHSQWLANYLKTGIRKVIGTQRRVYGVRKDGTRFLMEISVRQHRKQGENPVYISTITDLTKSLELDAAMELNAATQQMSSVPLICIDTLATVTVFNRAAEQCFGFTQEEAIGQNVNILMPEEIAKNHDGYLASYIKTGIKKVIDTERLTTGMRKNGQTFPVALHIKEVKLRDFGSSSLFLGYVRDRSADLVVEYQHMLHSTVSNLNPLPIITITDVGKVINFSMAAAKLLGHDQSDVVGNNVKMLMPDEIAVEHDEYLQRYLATGKRSIIDTARVLNAKHQDGTEVPITLEVKEVNISSARLYIASVTPLAAEHESRYLQAVFTQVVDRAPIPIIKISDTGAVQTYNHAAVSAFKYNRSEVIGHNVKMLCPPAVALKHDDYLLRYKNTREKHIIDTTFTTSARRSDGSVFMVRMTINEVISSIDNTSSYLAYAYEVEEERALEWTKMLGAQVKLLSRIPIIMIDQLGQILSFSTAGERCWQFTEEELLRQKANVRCLMEKQVADVHDSYLAKFLRTGIKTVIDSCRVVQAQKKNGDLFALNLFVKQLLHSGKPIYVGYAEDLTDAEALDKSRTIAAAVFDESPDPIFKADSFGSILATNKRASRLTGFAAEDMLSQNVKMIMPEQIALRHDEYLATYRKTGARTIIGKPTRAKLVTKMKQEISVELRIEEINLDEIEPQFVGFVRDITAFVAREEENLVADTLTSLSTTPLVAIDDKGIVLKYSKASERCFGYAPSEVLGKNVSMLMAPAIASNHDGYLRQYRKLGVKHVVDNVNTSQAMRKDGSQFSVELYVKEVVTNGTSLFLGYIRDCTDSMRELSTKKLVDAIFGLSSEAIVQISEKGIIEKVNLAAMHLSGYTMEELVGENVKMLTPPEIAAEHDKYLARYQKTKVKTVLNTTRIERMRQKNGDEVVVRLRAKEVAREGTTVYVAFLVSMQEEYVRQQTARMTEETIKLNNSPMVAITDTGKVTMFENAAMFGYEKHEVLDKNVKMLMPADVAVRHDGFLRIYKKTGLRKVMGGVRRVTAQHKKGHPIPVDLCIEEAIFNSKESFFVANFVDATEHYKQEAYTNVAAAIRNLSTSPLITINETGMILMWNKAAVRLWDIAEEDAVGSDVKRLMPKEIADQHDGYLERYLRTRVKRVIGGSSEVEGVKQGQRFPMLLYVREVTLDSGELNYIAFVHDQTRQKGAERGMKVNTAVVMHAPMAFVSITHRGIVQKFSNAACKVFGYSEEEVVGKNVNILMPEPTATAHDGYLARYQVEKVKHMVDSTKVLNGMAKNGSTVVLETRIKEVVVQGVSFFMGYIEEITSSTGMRNDRIISKKSLDLSPVPIVTIDVTCTVEFANQAACELFGYTADELMGHNVNVLMPPSVAVNHDGYIARYLAKESDTVLENAVRIFTAKHRSGKDVLIELRVSEIITDTHHLFVGFIRDHKKMVNLELSARLANVIRSLSPSPIITIDLKGTILSFNRAAVNRFGFAEEHVKNRNVRILMPDEISEKHDGYLRRYVTSGMKSQSEVMSEKGKVIQAESKAGSLFTARLRVLSVTDPKGDVNFVGVLQD